MKNNLLLVFAFGIIASTTCACQKASPDYGNAIELTGTCWYHKSQNGTTSSLQFTSSSEVNLTTAPFGEERSVPYTYRHPAIYIQSDAGTINGRVNSINMSITLNEMEFYLEGYIL